MPPTMHVTLVEPEIPPNTGTIARLCLATGSRLHLVGRLGFRLDEKTLLRAGLDYWQHVDVVQHDTFADCERGIDSSNVHFFSAHATRPYTDAQFTSSSMLVFGPETRGLPKSLLKERDNVWTIPQFDPRVRSLNLAVSAAIVLYEALRQIGWDNVRAQMPDAASAASTPREDAE